ncbi:MAG: tonB-dependent Receptor Plug domain protein [Herminiimonas sp.]|nr:tonB-dependent Receptor Plug domain protein [Herminiimonas sp.]MDB5853368.1 tonB-dependent Receptor Plug domain protein [Herminiimonas sp.]
MTPNVLLYVSAATKPVARPLALALVLSVFPAASAIAQAVNAPADLKTLAPVVVTATRMPEEGRDVLADHSTITSEEIARAGQSSLLELLQRQHGVEVTLSGGPASVSAVFLRGTSNTQNVVLVDGVRIGSSTSGGATWSSIPLTEIDHVEIITGPLSTMYGADAVGGVIQIFTKKGEGPPRLTAGAGIGTYGTRSEDISLSGSVEGTHRFSYAISASHEASDGFNSTRPGNFSFNPDKDGYSRKSVSGQFGLNLATGHDVGVVFLDSRLNAQFDSGATPADPHTQQQLRNLAVFTRNKFTSNWTSQVQISQSADKANSDTGAAPSRFNTTQKDVTWQNDFKLGTDRAQVLLERRIEQVEATTTALTGMRGTNSVAASYQLRRDRHLADFSLRNDNSSQFGSHTTGAAGYGYRLTNALRAGVSAGTSFRAPTFNDLFFPGFDNPTLRPEKGRNVEGGLYYDDGKTQGSAVVYRNRVTDLIIFGSGCPFQPANHPFGCAANVDEALLTGLTLAGSQRFGNWTTRAALDFQNPRDDTTGKLLARRSQQHATLAADYAVGSLKAGAEWVLSGRRFENAANTTVLGGYGMLNLVASYAVARDWTVVGRWNNVTDKNYELARDYATPGSNVFVGVRYAMR